jgi:DNA-binding PadR family transcriptional regulator
MEGKEVIKVVKRINEDKQKTLQLKQDKMKAKEKEKEDFSDAKENVCAKNINVRLQT